VSSNWNRKVFLFIKKNSKPIWTHFLLCFMSNTKASANSYLEVLPRSCQCPSLNSKGVIISSANSLFGLDRGKKLFQALPDVWGGEKKTLQAAKLLFYCVRRETPPGPSRNCPKVYEVNTRGRWSCTTFVSPAVLSKPPNFGDFSGRASFNRIGCFIFFTFTKVC
jgi:hypothetical protein